MEGYFIDSELLIKEVEKRPILYDAVIADYKNKGEKNKAWEEVSARVVSGWEQQSENERFTSVIDIQKRWRSIRDTFVKAHKTQSDARCGSGRHRRKYIYYEQMKFIIPTLKKRLIFESIGEHGYGSEWTDFKEEASYPAPDDDSRASIPTACQPVEMVDPLRTVDDFSEQHSTTPHPPRSGKRTASDSFKKELLAVLSTRHSRQEQEEDPDRMFLLSLLPHFREIPRKNKLMAQMEMMQSIRRAAQHSQCSSNVQSCICPSNYHLREQLIAECPPPQRNTQGGPYNRPGLRSHSMPYPFAANGYGIPQDSREHRGATRSVSTMTRSTGSSDETDSLLHDD